MLRDHFAGHFQFTGLGPDDAPPVFDGMAAANGRLLLVTIDGKVTCFGRE